MKRFSTIVLLCFGAILRLSGQSIPSDEEKALFNKINHYRDSLGLNKLVWDTSTYKMASHHAKYITIINSTPYNKGILTHKENVDNIDIPGFEEINTLDDRSKKFINKPYVYFAENCAITSVTKKVKISQSVFTAWLNSKEGHKQIMELKDVKIAACSIQIYEMEDVVVRTGKKFKVQLAAVVLNIH